MHVLLVEDHADTRVVLERLLMRWGHSVASADGVASGLEQIKRNEFDAIVSDIALGDGSGYQLMNEARREGVRAPAIAISAYRYPAAIEEPFVTGFDHHLSKPFSANALRTVLERREYRGDDEPLPLK